MPDAEPAETFQSTLPARGATLIRALRRAHIVISIHAPRTGSDGDRGGRRPRGVGISIHAPRTGSDERPKTATKKEEKFQSTLPARGATPFRQRRTATRGISIHAPRTGSDNNFTSSRSISIRISIHAPRTGSDSTSRRTRRRKQYFNPRSPHGERPLRMRRRTSNLSISIHAPRTGSDRLKCNNPRSAADFNPRSPHGERHYAGLHLLSSSCISIHAPRTGSDTCGEITVYRHKRFQSTLPARGATIPQRRNQRTRKNFNPRSPHGERPPPDFDPLVEQVFQSTLPARGATSH